LPFRVRRRPASTPETRAGFAERISDIHSRLDFHSAWLHVAAPPVAVLFDRLVKTVRMEVNPHVKAAWRESLITEDTGMNLGLGSIYVAPETDRLKGECTELMRRYLDSSWRSSMAHHSERDHRQGPH
jgi:hypothetical protein